MTPKQEFLPRRSPLQRKTWLAAWAEHLLFAGITSTDRLVRRRQLFTNIAAYAVAFTALVHFIVNAIHNFDGLIILNVYNVLMILFCVLNHRLHAYGDLVAAVTLAVGVAAGHLLVVFAFGTESDLQFYFTLAGLTLFLVGVENYRVFLALYAVWFAALLVSLLFAPDNGFVLPGDSEFRRSLAFEAAMNAFVINGLLFSFALTALYQAEERSEALLTTILPKRIAERLKVSPDGRHAVVVHQLSRFHLPTTQLERGWVNTSAVTITTLAAAAADAATGCSASSTRPGSPSVPLLALILGGLLSRRRRAADRSGRSPTAPV